MFESDQGAPAPAAALLAAAEFLDPTELHRLARAAPTLLGGAAAWRRLGAACSATAPADAASDVVWRAWLRRYGDPHWQTSARRQDPEDRGGDEHLAGAWRPGTAPAVFDLHRLWWERFLRLAVPDGARRAATLGAVRRNLHRLHAPQGRAPPAPCAGGCGWTVPARFSDDGRTCELCADVAAGAPGWPAVAAAFGLRARPAARTGRPGPWGAPSTSAASARSAGPPGGGSPRAERPGKTVAAARHLAAWRGTRW